MNSIILAGKENCSKSQIRQQREMLKRSYPGEHYFIEQGDYKPLFEINRKPMVQYVVDACKNSKNIDKVFVIGVKSKLEDKLSDCSILEHDGSIVKNALKGYYESNSKGPALFLTCDIPLVRKEHIDEFISDCLKYDNGLFVSVVEQEYLNGHEMQDRKYFALKEGNYRWANMFFGNPEKLNLNKLNRIIDILYRNRKLSSPIIQRSLIKDLRKELPLMEIFSKVIRYFLTSHLFKSKKLNACELEKMAKDYLNLDLKMVETRHYQPSLDVDSLEDFEYVKELMCNKKF